METNCIFCKIASKEIPASIVFENENILAFKDLKPQAPVHILVIPKKHIPTLNDIGQNDSELIGKIFLKIKDVARENGIAEDGYRVVANCNKDAGQEVFHVHMHLLGKRVFSWPPG